VADFSHPAQIQPFTRDEWESVHREQTAMRADMRETPPAWMNALRFVSEEWLRTHTSVPVGSGIVRQCSLLVFVVSAHSACSSQCSSVGAAVPSDHLATVIRNRVSRS
jgi:hypothetical protein